MRVYVGIYVSFVLIEEVRRIENKMGFVSFGKQICKSDGSEMTIMTRTRHDDDDSRVVTALGFQSSEILFKTIINIVIICLCIA